MFRSQNHIDEIKGVYVPFWLYDSDADAQLRFTATRTRFWSDDDYDYTETSYYSVRRDGVLGFDAVPVDGSSKMADDLMESIEPFTMQDAVPFKTAYLAGYVADKYDVDAQKSIQRANERIRQSTEDAFTQTVTGYDSVKMENSSIQLHGGKAKYALFPVWVLSTSWQGNNYIFAMNGQTGKFVGNLPVDKAAARKWTLGLTAAVGAASYAVHVAAVAGRDSVKEGRKMKRLLPDCAPSVLRWPHWCCGLRWPHRPLPQTALPTCITA